MIVRFKDESTFSSYVEGRRGTSRITSYSGNGKKKLTSGSFEGLQRMVLLK